MDWNDQCDILRRIQQDYPTSDDLEDCKHSRAEYAAKETGLDYDMCYKILNAIDLDEN